MKNIDRLKKEIMNKIDSMTEEELFELNIDIPTIFTCDDCEKRFPCSYSYDIKECTEKFHIWIGEEDNEKTRIKKNRRELTQEEKDEYERITKKL